MMDDFSALDLLSMGGFKLSPTPIKPKGPKLRFLGKRRKPQAAAKRRLAQFLPLIGRKFHLDGKTRWDLQGWPVALSWPSKEIAQVDPWADHGNAPHS